METDTKITSGFSPEYQQFWRIRGLNADSFDQSPRPTTPEELAKATAITDKLLDILKEPTFRKIRQNLVSLAADWMKDGLITEDQHMEIVRTKEILTDGETTEDYLKKIIREN